RNYQFGIEEFDSIVVSLAKKSCCPIVSSFILRFRRRRDLLWSNENCLFKPVYGDHWRNGWFENLNCKSIRGFGEAFETYNPVDELLDLRAKDQQKHSHDDSDDCGAHAGIMYCHSANPPNATALSCKRPPPAPDSSAAGRLPRRTRSGWSEVQPTC